jgi:23S rRNA (pseudouridine1915-N3)-methyltransferase
MAREILVLWAGRHRRDDWDELCGRYRERIARFVDLREIPVRVKGSSVAESRLRLEGEALMASAPKQAWTVALDSRGTTRSSPKLASWLQGLMEEWPHPIAFLLGSDLGLDREVLSRSRDQLSFGPMTLPHELARLVLYEQIYRAFCITAGIKYHRGPL